MSIAHSFAKLALSRSSTSSLKAWSPPSGMAIRRTGRSRLESHEAALIRCEMWSRLRWISDRFRIPVTVGISPTAVYGSGMLASWNSLSPWDRAVEAAVPEYSRLPGADDAADPPSRASGGRFDIGYTRERRRRNSLGRQIG